MAKTKSLPIENINAAAELERLGWKYEPIGRNELKLLCPVHEDSSPSVNLDVEKNQWKCHSCPARGDVITLIQHIATKITKQLIERSTIIAELSSRYNLEEIKQLSQELIEKHHAKINDAGPMLKALYDRGVTDVMIRDARIGYWDGRISIPVYDEKFNAVNIRRYLPGAPGPDKMRNLKGYGTPPRIYQVDDLKYAKVWVLGGEIKALVAKHLLNPFGVGAVALTGGETNWENRYTIKFKGKIVYICYDIDAAGQAGARKLADILSHVASKVYIVFLPLDPQKYHKGDVNDYVGAEGATGADLAHLMDTAEEYIHEDVEEAEGKEAVKVKLVEATRPEHVGHRLEMEGIVTAMEETPYLVPQTVAISCDRKQPGCHMCPVYTMDPDKTTGQVKMKIKGTSLRILDMVNAPEKLQREATREALRIPVCKAAVFHVKDHYNVWDVRLMPQLRITGSNSDHITIAAVIVGQDVDLNSPYLMEGRVHPHPKTQQAMLVIDTVSRAEDSLSSFAPSHEELSSLEILRPSEWTTKAIKEKLDEYYDDLEANVTRIYCRRKLHLLVDLCYHSTLYFNFDGRLQNGWVNILVAGDTSQGKSEAPLRMMGHYGLGERVECKNATTAGLLGGLEQIANKYFVRWGVIPTHDRRLVMLDEINGGPPELIWQMTDMRSSGIAELQKIEKRRAHARTRLIMTGNARSNKRVSQFNFGVELIQELIGSPQDIRRFDAAIILASSQIDPEEINRLQKSRPAVKHRFTEDICRRAVLWAWTRTPEQVVFESEAETGCLHAAADMCKKFAEEMPLVDKGTMKYKLARLSVSVAAMTYSTAEGDPNTIVVRPCHVEFVKKFLDSLYCEPTFGYEDFSNAQGYATTIIDPEIVVKHITNQKFPKDLVDHMLHTTEITLTDIQDWTEGDRETAQRLLSFMVRKHAMYRDGRFYTKTSTFIALLKRMKLTNLPSGSEQTKEKF